MPKKILKYFFLLILVVSAAAINRLDGALLRNFPVTITQPDGVVIHCFASGDEFYNWLHDENGYTIIQDPVSGYYTYAVVRNGELVSSEHIVGRVDPVSLGLPKNANTFPQQISRKFAAPRQGSPLNPDSILKAPRAGTLNNIVIFIRFSGDSEFPEASSVYDTMFNSTAPGANSMRNYYAEVSYSQLTVSTSFYPAPSGGWVTSYQDSHPRGYFRPYNVSTNPTGYTNSTDSRNREHTLLANAVSAVASLVPPGLNIDGDGDGYVDNVCFIIKGSPDGWSDLLWPHMWSLYTLTATINSKRVFTYNFQLENSLGTNDVGVLAHEMFHSLGAPDLYHYSFDGISPAYAWDLMENDLNPPQHMTAYMKMRYGTWLSSIPTITTSGTYTLNPLTSSTNNAFKIVSPNSSTEYFVIEYRKKAGTFENSLLGEGLIVYRINTLEDGQGNSNGPPDELYVYRPGGTVSANGSPSQANFNSTAGRTAINDSSNPSSFLSTGSAGGLNISDVGAAGDTISFTVSVADADTIRIVVEPSGSPNPVIPAGTAGLFVVATDSLGHTLTYAWTASCPALGSNGSFSDPNVQTPAWTAPSNTTGTMQSCTMQVTVSDGHGKSTQGSYSQGVGSTTPGVVPHFAVSGTTFVGRQHGQTEVMGDLTLTCDVPGIFPSSSSFVVVYTPVFGIVNSSGNTFTTATAVAFNGRMAHVESEPPTTGISIISALLNMVSTNSLTVQVAGSAALGDVIRISGIRVNVGEATLPFNTFLSGTVVAVPAASFQIDNINTFPVGFVLDEIKITVAPAPTQGSCHPGECKVGTIKVIEKFPGALSSVGDENDVLHKPNSVGAKSASKGTQLIVTLGNIPPGMTASWPASISNGDLVLALEGSTTSFTNASATTPASVSFTYNVTGDSQVLNETIDIAVTFCATSVPTPPVFGDITAGVKLGPNAGAGFTAEVPSSNILSFVPHPLNVPTDTIGGLQLCLLTPPTVTTDQATNVSTSSATLNGTVTPNGLATTVVFEWGTTRAYGNTTPVQSIGDGTGGASVTANLTGLTPDTLYHYRVTAINSAGTTQGGDTPFVASLCSAYYVDPSSQSFSAQGGNGSVSVSAACNWTAVPSDPWIIITSGGIGNGDGPINYAVGSHSNPTSRGGTITIGATSLAVLQGAQFADVPVGHMFYDQIGKLSARGVTTGCGGGNYCPDASVTREQMAIFIEHALGVMTAPIPTQQTFQDVPTSWFSYPFIEDFALRGITAGCSITPRLYCPASTVTREQMAIFIEHALGVVTPPAPAQQTFEDVPTSWFSYPFIEDFATRGITAGCSVSPKLYCPASPVTHGQMAAFLVRAFWL